MSLNESGENDRESFGTDTFDTVIIFCEGVLRKGDEKIEGSTRAIETLKNCGKRILYFSRDDASSRQEICENMRLTGYDVLPTEIVRMTAVMAQYLKKLLGDKKIYTIGSAGITEEFNLAGLRHFGSGPDILSTDLATFVHSFEEDPEVGAVAVGFDEHFSYPKMLRAASYLSNPKIPLVTNSRRSKIAAAMLDCVETCSQAGALIFEDRPALVEQNLIDGYHISPERTLIIGPGHDENIRLMSFDQLERQLYVGVYKGLDEPAFERIFHAENLAEMVSRLKI